MCKECKVVHLHVHTEYSTTDGASSPDDIVRRAVEIDSPAVAITDHGNTAGWHPFYDSAKKHGIKPILGMEGYLIDETDAAKRRNYHQLLLAMNRTGSRNIQKLTELAAKQVYYKPRFDLQQLYDHSEGVIATSSCMGGIIPKHLMNGDYRHAVSLTHEFLDVYGDRFFLEVQYRENVPEQDRLNSEIFRLGKDTGTPVIVTSDAHYAKKSDWKVQSVLQRVSKNKEGSAGDTFDDHTFYLVEPDILDSAFSGTDALRNTLLINEMVESFDLYNHGYVLPHVQIPDGYTYDTYLESLVMDGVKILYNNDSTALERARYELSVIKQMGMSQYFLVVRDITTFAKQSGIPHNTRGSAAGSVVCYVIGISNIDPLAMGLKFERFLNPARVTMPDIDLDFADDRRSDVVKYVYDNYGGESGHVVGISTVSFMHAKQAIRDSVRIHGMPITIAEEMTDTVPFKMEKVANEIDWLYQNVPAYEKLADKYNTVHETARQLSGIVRQFGQHAAGLVVTDKPVSEYVSVMPATSKTNAFASVGVDLLAAVTHPTAEKIGLLKIDFLGLSTLAVVNDVTRKNGLLLENIPFQYTGNPFSDRKLRKAFELICSGNTAGVFQLEGSGMTETLVAMQPSNVEQIIALLALYRPGPMQYIEKYIRRMKGKEEITYRHPLLEPILKETFGIPVYQEQIMSIAMALFGYSASESDMIRKAIAKSDAAGMAEHERRFHENGSKNGLTHDVISGIWSDIKEFAHYAFNKAHAASYGVLSVRTAYLKANYPADYMAALMCRYTSDVDRLQRQISECPKLGIPVLPLSIDDSDVSFTSDGKSIRVGFSQVHGVGLNAAQKLYDAIKKAGNTFDEKFKVFYENTNKGVRDSLILCGVFDRYTKNRKAVFELSQKYSDKKKSKSKKKSNIPAPVFDFFGVSVETESLMIDIHSYVDKFTQKELVEHERKLLRVITFSDNPEIMREVFAPYYVTPVSTIFEAYDSMVFRVGGFVSNVRVIRDKKDNEMAFITISDYQKTGNIDVVCFHSVWSKSPVVIGDLVVTTGRYDSNGSKIVATGIEVIQYE